MFITDMVSLSKSDQPAPERPTKSRRKKATTTTT
jgi:hypothetical protein